jgi:hypothetical protein
VSTESLLSEYLSNARETQERAEHSEVVKRIEEIFDELKLPWKRDADDWSIGSDVGEVMAGLDEAEEVLSFWQLLFPIAKPPKKNGELFHEMLSANAGTTGACFAISHSEGSPPYALVVGRISAKDVDPSEVALTLSSVFYLASLGN